MNRTDIMVKDLKKEIMDNLSGWGNAIGDIGLECSCLFAEHTGVEVVNTETYKELGKLYMVVSGETRDEDFKDLAIKLELAEVEDGEYTPINIFQDHIKKRNHIKKGNHIKKRRIIKIDNIESNLRELIGNSYYSMKELREDIIQAFEVGEDEMVYARYFTGDNGADHDVLIRAYVDNPEVEPHRIKVKHVDGEEVVVGVK